MKHQWKLDEYGKPDEWAWESGFHNGVYCERCGKTVCIHCDPDWELMDDCKEPPNPKPQTNADRIRAMSDEELAHFMVERNVNESTLQLFDKDYELTAVHIEALKQRLYCACMQWLKQPVEE